MTLQLFLVLLLICSIITGLTVEGVKKILDEWGKKYYSNALAGIVAIVVAIIIGIGYYILSGLSFDVAFIVYLIALIFLSWLSAMVGYDKVIQAITQLKNKSDE